MHHALNDKQAALLAYRGHGHDERNCTVERHGVVEFVLKHVEVVQTEGIVVGLVVTAVERKCELNVLHTPGACCLHLLCVLERQRGCMFGDAVDELGVHEGYIHRNISRTYHEESTVDA